jgi:predicted SprT family Zn-dependent metalloprotease
MELAKLESEWKTLQAKWNLKEWTLGYHNKRRSFGTCYFLSKRIMISRWHAVNDPEKHVLDTLRHEIAHALAGKDAGHGPEWKRWAVLVGATPERCMNHSDATECIRPPGKYVATCPTCGHVYNFYRKPKQLTGWNCKKCGKDRGKLVFREVEQKPAKKIRNLF